MAGELSFVDKAKGFIQEKAVVIVMVLVAVVGYCLFRMKKRNVKLFGR